MDFMIIAGPGQTGKTTYLQDQIIDTTLKEPEQRVIYIVPEQSTLMVQQQLLDRHPRHGIMKVEILSFNRLAYRVLQETGADQNQTLDDMGKSMLLYKTALDHKEELVYYQDSIHKQGFIGQLKIMMTEIYQYRLDPSFFERIMSTLDPDSTLYRKLHDIRILTEAFRERTKEGSIPTERLLDLLEEQIPKSDLLRDADIYMDDFFGFTPQQYAVLAKVWGMARKVRLTLPIDRETLKSRKAVEGSMYYQSLKIMRRLKEMGISGSIHFLGESHKPEELKILMEQLFQTQTPTQKIEDPKGRICVYKAERPEEEVEWVLSRIMQDVRYGGLHFHEIAVLVGAEETYLPLLERMGKRYQIPVFIDRRAELKDHPVVRMLTDALSMCQRRYSYDTVFTWAKSGFLPYDQEALDALENQALAWGYRGRERYHQAFLELAEGNEDLTVRTEALFDALAQLERSRALADQYTDALRGFMEVMHLEEQIEEQTAWLRDAGQVQKAAFYEQTMTAIFLVLDQMHAVLGQEEVDLKAYTEILFTGLSQSRIGILPPSRDQIQVADLNRSRIANIQALYVMGFQDEYFPSAPEEAGLLSDTERRRIALYQDVAADRMLRMGEQIFFLYSAIGKAAQKVTFSYSASDGRGGSMRPSQYVGQLEAMIPRDQLYAEDSVLPMHPDWLLDILARQSEDTAKSKEEKRWLARHDRRELLKLLEQGRSEELPQEMLDQEELWQLMDLDHRAVSVTQLEQYASCPFSYFLRYGLNIREREVLDVRPLDDGNVLHALLENVGQELKALVDLTDAEIEERMDRIQEEEQEAFSRYKASSRYQYYWNKLKKSAVRAMHVIQEQIRRGEFVPEVFEWTFGSSGARRSALQIQLADGKSLMLMGKIDRVDVLREGTDSFVRILDYKTGRTKWNLWEIFEGVKLQLPLYMEAYQEKEGGKPAGLFYFHLIPPVIKGDQKAENPKREEQVLKSMQLDGILLDDPWIVEKMDEDLKEKSGNSKIIPAGLTKNGALTANSSKASEQQFQALLALAHHKAEELGQGIAQGHVEPHPVKDGLSVTCDYCPYHSACRLDPAKDLQYLRRIDQHKDEDFWETIL